MKATVPTLSRPRGRPRSFDRERALDAAMLLFWRKGFESTSISDLTEALGINPPSLYAAFGDKERLFLEAVARYQAAADREAKLVYAESATAREVVERLLEQAVAGLTRAGHPAGCMLVTAAATCSAASTKLQADLVKCRAASRRMLQSRLVAAVTAGELPVGTDPGGLARFYTTVIQGMTTQRLDGASRKALQATASMAMRAWPSLSTL